MGKLFRPVTALMVVAALLSTASPAFARHELAMAGSNGDAGAKAECPPGQTLAGFSGLRGLWVDAIQLVCAGPSGQPVAMGPRYGGGGGGPQDSFCPRAWQLTALTLNLTTRNRQVAAINFSCRSRTAGETSDFAFGNPSYRARCPGFGVGDCGMPSNIFQVCAADEEAIGFNVRYGKDVNGFGLICGRKNGMR